MFKIAEINKNREYKLKTLSGAEPLEKVLEDFKEELSYLGANVEQQKILDVVEYALAQDYGASLLAKNYVTHPIRVAIFLIGWMREIDEYSTDVLVAALIHNVIEKNVLSPHEIEVKFGSPWISHTIEILTQDREAMKDPHKKEMYYEEIYKLDKFGQILKFFDKFDNLYAICINPDDEVRKKYIDEIMEKVRPIGVRFAPSLLPYLDALIIEMRKFGYYPLPS